MRYSKKPNWKLLIEYKYAKVEKMFNKNAVYGEKREMETNGMQ